MRYDELIEAIESGRLYHWMNLSKSTIVFESNAVTALFSHYFELLKKSVHGISVSRNSQYNHGTDSVVRLVFDLDKLKTKYKVVPLDGDRAVQLKNPKYKDNVESARKLYADWGKFSNAGEVQEEFIIGDVISLNRYLARIDMIDTSPEDLKGLIESYATKYGIAVQILTR
jgi:hypothetical protein